MLLTLAAMLTAAAPGCLQARGIDAPVTLEGRVERRTYRDNIGRLEPSYILVVDRPICLDDGGEYADPRVHFRRVQLVPWEDQSWAAIHAAAGHRIRIRGTGFAARTGHHHTPLVVEVRQIAMLRR